MEKRWRKIKDHENYEVSDEGDIRNSKTGKILSHSIDEQNDDIVFMYEGSAKYKRKVSRLVAEAYLYGDLEHSYIEQIDNNKRNVRADNLKLKPKRIGKRAKVPATGKIYDSIKDCSRDLGVSASTISKCLNYKFHRNQYGYHFEEVK